MRRSAPSRVGAQDRATGFTFCRAHLGVRNGHLQQLLLWDSGLDQAVGDRILCRGEKRFGCGRWCFRRGRGRVGAGKG